MKMEKDVKKVEDLHKKFTLPVRENPSLIPKNEFEFRYQLIKEEMEEYHFACENQDLPAVADALGDMLYALYGTVVHHGLQDKIQDIFDEIHASNMSKLDDNGNPILREDGKIIKSSNYFKPKISSILEKEK